MSLVGHSRTSGTRFRQVRFTHNSGHCSRLAACQLSANFGSRRLAYRLPTAAELNSWPGLAVGLNEVLDESGATAVGQAPFADSVRISAQIERLLAASASSPARSWPSWMNPSRSWIGCVSPTGRHQGSASTSSLGKPLKRPIRDETRSYIIVS